MNANDSRSFAFIRGFHICVHGAGAICLSERDGRRFQTDADCAPPSLGLLFRVKPAAGPDESETGQPYHAGSQPVENATSDRGCGPTGEPSRSPRPAPGGVGLVRIVSGDLIPFRSPRPRPASLESITARLERHLKQLRELAGEFNALRPGDTTACQIEIAASHLDTSIRRCRALLREGGSGEAEKPKSQD